MAYMYYNSNPFGKIVGDCVIRAISKAEDIPWLKAYTELAMFGMENGDIPSSNTQKEQFLSQIPKEMGSNPNQIIQNLMNSGRISQSQYNQAKTLADQIQSFGK